MQHNLVLQILTCSLLLGILLFAFNKMCRHQQKWISFMSLSHTCLRICSYVMWYMIFRLLCRISYCMAYIGALIFWFSTSFKLEFYISTNICGEMLFFIYVTSVLSPLDIHSYVLISAVIIIHKSNFWKTVVLCRGNALPSARPSVRPSVVPPGYPDLFQHALRYQFDTNLKIYMQ